MKPSGFTFLISVLASLAHSALAAAQTEAASAPGWSYNVAGGGMRGALLQPDICFAATPQRPGLTFLPNTHLEWGQG